MITTKSLWLAALFAIVSFAACDSDDAGDNPNTESTSAVLYAINTSSPDGFIMYMGAYAEFPETEPDRANMVELGSLSDAVTYNGDVFSFNWDTRTVTKWEVSPELALNRGTTISFANVGIPAYAPFTFHSETRAFVFDVLNGQVVEWNPTDMSITETTTITMAPNGYSSLAYRHVQVHNDRILLVVNNIDPDSGFKVDDMVMVGLYDVNSKTMEYKTDARMSTTSSSVMDSQGIVYLTPNRGIHFPMVFGNNADVTNFGKMLRFDMNTGEFDPSFEMDLGALVEGSPSHVYLLNDNEIVVETTVEPLPESITPDNYYAVARATLKKVSVSDEQVTDYTVVGENVQSWINNVDFIVGDALFFPAGEFPDNDYAKVNTRLFRVTSSGAGLLYEANNSWPVTIQKIR
ncbi:MAG: hypothetical protein AAGE93_02450 [Bacteroidota bacterium]